MELVTKLIWVLIPVLGMARYVFWVEISQQNRGFGFVFKDKISKGFDFKKHLLSNLLPDNKASSPSLFLLLPTRFWPFPDHDGFLKPVILP
jgi:hypothetical protein